MGIYSCPGGVKKYFNLKLRVDLKLREGGIVMMQYKRLTGFPGKRFLVGL